MQFCDFSALREKGAKSELARLIQENFISAEDGERVRLDEIEKFRGSRLLDEILGARAVHREMRFHARMPAVLFTQDEKKRRALGEHRILVQGVIDCLFENEEGEISLIDYKTDRLPREALSDAALAAKILSDKHHEQLSYYAIAVEQMFGKRPRHIRVYSLHLGKTVDIEA
jgi:ATP-dependent helicase/nuclease subunit A